jgi:hypothetical protein
MSDSEEETQSKNKEDYKQKEYDGYQAYKNELDVDKLLTFTYNFNPMKSAIDKLFKMCYDNNLSSVG